MSAHNQPEQPLLLTIELVPQPCWYNNLRKVMSPSDWDSLRRQVYREYGHRCGICGATEVMLHCHERWAYDDDMHMQRLGGFIALCEWCHHVKHMGHAGILAQQGKLDLHKVVGHFLRVNNCDEATFQRHSDAAWDTWRKRSQFTWRTDLGTYAGLVKTSLDKPAR